MYWVYVHLYLLYILACRLAKDSRDVEAVEKANRRDLRSSEVVSRCNEQLLSPIVT